MAKRFRVLWIVGAAAVVIVLAAGYGYYRKRLPRYQIVGQSIGNVGIALSMYIDETGEMPSSLDDLIRRGIVKRDNKYQSWFAALIRNGYIRPPQSGQLVLTVLDKPIFAFDDVEVMWSARASDLTLRDGRLVSAETGEPVYLVRSKCRYFLLNDDDVDMNSSVRFYKRLVEKGRP